jgi:hypothetical protein
MQSVVLKSFRTLSGIARRSRPLSLTSAMVLAGLLSGHAQTVQPAAPQTKFDVGVGGFYQVTQATNGNFIRNDTTESGGALFSLRQPYRPWLGWEANVGYTKFYDSYNKNNVKIESNVTDFSFSYLFQSPTVWGVQPYASLGGGVIVFSPIQGTLTNLLTSQTSLPSQIVPEFAYNIGLGVPVFSRLGVRGGLRGIICKTPDYHQDYLNTQRLRTTLEPNLTIYYRF